MPRCAGTPRRIGNQPLQFYCCPRLVPPICDKKLSYMIPAAVGISCGPMMPHQCPKTPGQIDISRLENLTGDVDMEMCKNMSPNNSVPFGCPPSQLCAGHIFITELWMSIDFPDRELSSFGCPGFDSTIDISGLRAYGYNFGWSSPRATIPLYNFDRDEVDEADYS